MTKILFVVTFLLLEIFCGVAGYNYSSFYDNNDDNNRDGKFLFDTLFGLELEEELISNDATNSLKSCDCGKSREACGCDKRQHVDSKM